MLWNIQPKKKRSPKILPKCSFCLNLIIVQSQDSNCSSWCYSLHLIYPLQPFPCVSGVNKQSVLFTLMMFFQNINLPVIIFPK